MSSSIAIDFIPFKYTGIIIGGVMVALGTAHPQEKCLERFSLLPLRHPLVRGPLIGMGSYLIGVRVLDQVITKTLWTWRFTILGLLL